MVVHGGAWNIPDELADRSVKGVKRAVKEGFKLLRGGGSAVEAVESAVKHMEMDPTFGSGL